MSQCLCLFFPLSYLCVFAAGDTALICDISLAGSSLLLLLLLQHHCRTLISCWLQTCLCCLSDCVCVANCQNSSLNRLSQFNSRYGGGNGSGGRFFALVAFVFHHELSGWMTAEVGSAEVGLKFSCVCRPAVRTVSVSVLCNGGSQRLSVCGPRCCCAVLLAIQRCCC